MPVQKMEVPNLHWLNRIIYKGCEGKDVKQLQERLEILNIYYKFHPGQTLENTGSFGRKTRSFVIRFQIWADLCTDGWVDKATADAIHDFFQAVAQQTYYPAAKSSNPLDRF